MLFFNFTQYSVGFKVYMLPTHYFASIKVNDWFHPKSHYSTIRLLYFLIGVGRLCVCSFILEKMHNMSAWSSSSHWSILIIMWVFINIALKYRLDIYSIILNVIVKAKYVKNTDSLVVKLQKGAVVGQKSSQQYF